MSGWTNYSGKVTNQKMSENEMNNRGSKSVFFFNNTVKEQRVDGNYFGFNLIMARQPPKVKVYSIETKKKFLSQFA